MNTIQDVEPLTRIANTRPIQVCEGLELSEAARTALVGDPSPSDFVAALLEGECHDDAIRYLAYALPRRDAVRWASDCVRGMRGEALSAAARVALAAARHWAAAPDAGHARQAAEAAQADGMEGEGGARFAALAAAWSGDSLAPPGLPPTAPPPGLGAEAVEASVMIATVEGDPALRQARCRDALAHGIRMARAAP